MTVSDIARLYEYSYWANRKVFRAAGRLTPEQFVQEVAGSFGSIRNTLVHAMSAEWGWLERCDGRPRGPRLNPDDFPTSDSVTRQWSALEGFVREFLALVTDADLSRRVYWELPGGLRGRRRSF